MELNIDFKTFTKIRDIARSYNISFKKLTAEFAKIGMENYLKEIGVPGSKTVERIGKLNETTCTATE